MNDSIAPLRDFVRAMTHLIDRATDEKEILLQGRQHLDRLIAHDGWLPAEFSTPHSDRYAQYLLHCDPLERFSVMSVAWGPDQCTPIHDHTVWGLVGVIRGAERCEEFAMRGGVPQSTGRSHIMRPGAIESVSPTLGDWHRVSSAAEHGASVSIHVYGSNIAATRRHRLDASCSCVEFLSRYDNTVVPNLWNLPSGPRL